MLLASSSAKLMLSTLAVIFFWTARVINQGAQVVRNLEKAKHWLGGNYETFSTCFKVSSM